MLFGNKAMKRIISGSAKIKYTALSLSLALLLAAQGCAFADMPGISAGEHPSEETGVETVEEGASPIIVIDSPAKETEPKEPEAEEAPVEEPEVRDFDNRFFTMKANDPDEVTLSFVGDINFCDDYANMRVLRDEEGGNLAGCVLPEVTDVMKSADIMMANNEFAYSDRGSPTPNKQYTFRAKPEHITKLHEMGIDIVSLANNHAYDWGPDALMDTFALLRDNDVPYVGAGENLTEAMKPVYFKVNGRTLSYVSATQIERTPNPDTREATETDPGVLRTLDPSRFVEVIREAEANSDFVIVYVHWGSESTDLVEASQRELAEKYADAGADLIIGDHSHCLQGIDYVKGVPVFYSLGNFWFNSKTLDTCIITVTVETSAPAETADPETEIPGFAETLPIRSLKFVPCIQKSCRTRLADETESARIYAYLQGICDHAAVDENGIITYSEENRNTQGGVNTFPGRKKAEPEGAEALPPVPDGAETAAPPAEGVPEAAPAGDEAPRE